MGFGEIGPSIPGSSNANCILIILLHSLNTVTMGSYILATVTASLNTCDEIFSTAQLASYRATRYVADVS